jgi:hypothetical protein
VHQPGPGAAPAPAMAAARPAATTVRQAGAASRPPSMSSTCEHSSAARAGSDCRPARLRASAVDCRADDFAVQGSLCAASVARFEAGGAVPAAAAPSRGSRGLAGPRKSGRES